MHVIIYGFCNGCDDSGYVKKIADMRTIPRVGDILDGLTVRKIKYCYQLNEVTICTSNTESLIDCPDSARPLGREMLHKRGYEVCSMDEWAAGYYL